ncbi:MAG: hypothetical protein ABIL46_08115 [candidate division WOR-3 bacterium]
MVERRKTGERRKKERRKTLTEAEFRKLIETGKTGPNDRRSWVERRKTKRRRIQTGI